MKIAINPSPGEVYDHEKDQKSAPTWTCMNKLEMGKTRNLFKKIRDTKGTFHTKMGAIKDRNGMDLTGAEDIKKTWQEHTEELYQKILMTQITTMV